MPNYLYVASYPLFFPDKHDADGQSLMAQAGMIVEWDEVPGAAEWVQTDELANWGGPAPKAPEPVQEPVSVPEPASQPEPAPVPAQVPEVPQSAPEPAPAQPVTAVAQGPMGHGGSGQAVQPLSN